MLMRCSPGRNDHEVPVGKGLCGVLKLVKERGSLEETVEWGCSNTDKRKSKLGGINEPNEEKEIHIERLDEFGRSMTLREQFRKLSHAFHGKEPGKKKKEKRIKQAQEELKRKRMKSSATPSLSVERRSGSIADTLYCSQRQCQTLVPYVLNLAFMLIVFQHLK